MVTFAESRDVCYKAGFSTVMLECDGHDYGHPRMVAWLEKFAQEKSGRGYGDAEREVLESAYFHGRADAVLMRLQGVRA